MRPSITTLLRRLNSEKFLVSAVRTEYRKHRGAGGDKRTQRQGEFGSRLRVSRTYEQCPIRVRGPFMPNVLRWTIFFPVSFIVWALSGFLIAGIGGLLRLPNMFQIIPFFIAGFLFVWTGAFIVPSHSSFIAGLLAVVMLLVNWTSPARIDCRVAQALASLIAFVLCPCA